MLGKPFTYTLTVRNNGPDRAGAVSLYDPLPYGTTFVSATPSQGYLLRRRVGRPAVVMGAQFNIETWQAPYDLSIDNVQFVAPPKTKTSCVPIAR